MQKYIKTHYSSFLLSIFILLTPAYFIMAVEAEKYDVQHCVNELERSNPTMHIGIKAIPLAPYKDGSHFVNDDPSCNLNADHLFIPASNTKIVTALSALEYLGPDYRFETSLLFDGAIDNTTLNGSLYIKGAGDPSLTRSHLSQLIATLSSHNIVTITGNIYIDVTIFDQDFFPPGSFIDNIGYGWNAPITGLSVDGKGVCSTELNYGCLANDDKLKANFYDIHPLLSDILAELSISLVGTVTLKATPSDAQLLTTHRSKTVSILLQQMMKNSDNLYADCFFKKIGAIYAKLPGSWQNGEQILKNLIEKMAIDPKTVIIMDGSGKSRYNLISPSHIVTMLQWAYKQPYFSHFFNSLAIAGRDGTLQKRMPELAGLIRGKTGTLQGVSALSGYAITGMHNEMVAFSVLVNGYIADSLYNPPCKSEIENMFCSFLIGQLDLENSHATA